jgi:hypothetical protein
LDKVHSSGRDSDPEDAVSSLTAQGKELLSLAQLVPDHTLRNRAESTAKRIVSAVSEFSEEAPALVADSMDTLATTAIAVGENEVAQSTITLLADKNDVPKSKEVAVVVWNAMSSVKNAALRARALDVALDAETSASKFLLRHVATNSDKKLVMFSPDETTRLTNALENLTYASRTYYRIEEPAKAMSIRYVLDDYIKKSKSNPYLSLVNQVTDIAREGGADSAIDVLTAAQTKIKQESESTSPFIKE